MFADAALPFLIEAANVRGKLVRLGPAMDTILRRHAYPGVVSRELAELLLITATLGSNLKADGVVTAQVKGMGPVRFMVADATTEGELRGYADADFEAVDREVKAEPKLPQDENDRRLFRRFFGEGYLMVTVDHGDYTERYQSIVALEGESLTDSLRHYFVHSQQVEVILQTAIGIVERPGQPAMWHGACLLLERLPRPEGRTASAYDDDWTRMGMLMETVGDHELLDPTLDPETLLFRLFHEDGVWAYDPREVSADCRCSRERIIDILRSFPEEEMRTMRDDDGAIRVTCQFCNTTETFTTQQQDALRR